MSQNTKPRDEWIVHLERWKESDLNQSEYCRLNGLKPHKFTYWKKRLQSPENDDSKFVKLPNIVPAVKSNQGPYFRVSIDSDLCLKISVNIDFERIWRIL